MTAVAGDADLRTEDKLVRRSYERIAAARPRLQHCDDILSLTAAGRRTGAIDKEQVCHNERPTYTPAARSSAHLPRRWLTSPISCSKKRPYRNIAQLDGSTRSSRSCARSLSPKWGEEERPLELGAHGGARRTRGAPARASASAAGPTAVAFTSNKTLAEALRVPQPSVRPRRARRVLRRADVRRKRRSLGVQTEENFLQYERTAPPARRPRPRSIGRGRRARPTRLRHAESSHQVNSPRGEKPECVILHTDCIAKRREFSHKLDDRISHSHIYCESENEVSIIESLPYPEQGKGVL
ncbi:hypothetical protein EVAR_24148_1 [Eumeta japonica]|uniref:Uncharacterized protein n=1 Tax=Eumeta variegata TaxID=151549 RepID=A0A4C1YLX6_EUMVA|nr:hypothetical protein EVAR_24148_1 [Eumeta japonica]